MGSEMCIRDSLYTVENNSCEAQDTLIVSFIEAPIADAGIDDAVCSLSYNLSASSSTGNGTWSSSDPSAVFSNLNDPNATVTVNSYGTVTFTWTVDNNGCSDSDDVNITFNPPASTSPIFHN